jgi:hypothetical protein
LERTALDIAIEKPVKGCVTLYAGLRQDHEIRSIFLSLLDCPDDAGCIGLPVAISCVDLADGNEHKGSVFAPRVWSFVLMRIVPFSSRDGNHK